MSIQIILKCKCHWAKTFKLIGNQKEKNYQKMCYYSAMSILFVWGFWGACEVSLPEQGEGIAAVREAE